MVIHLLNAPTRVVNDVSVTSIPSLSPHATGATASGISCLPGRE
jgi:hypothetical protein